MNFGLLAKTFPQATASLRAWVDAQAPVRGWGKVMPIDKTPIELSLGIYEAYFRSSGIIFSKRIAGDGTMEVTLYTLRRKSGRFAPLCSVVGNGYLQHDVVLQKAYIRALKEIERVIDGHPSDEEQEDGS